MDFWHILLLLVVGMMAGFINVVAGGGSSLTLPALIFLGLDSALANGTNRIAILIQNIFAIWGFQQEKLNQFKISLKLALFTLPGAIAGAVIAIRITDLWFERILGVIMIMIVASLFIPKPGNKYDSGAGKQPRWITYPVLFVIGFYGGFIQVGVGFLLMATLFHFARMSLVYVNVHKVFIVLLYTLPAILIFILSGNVNWLLGLTLALGNGFGGWLAARVSVKKGEKFIRYVLAVIIIIMSVKLLLQF